MARGILSAAVFVALVIPWRLLGIGRCLIDRRHHCARAGVRMLSTVNGTCAEVF